MSIAMAGARHFQQLTVWQLADELRGEVLKLTARPQFLRDLKLRAQTEDAVESTCRNIAEGFGCDTHREFSRFLEISRRSVNELQDCFQAALHHRFISHADLRPCRVLMNRLFPALSRFIAYLDATPDLPTRPRRADSGKWIGETMARPPRRSTPPRNSRPAHTRRNAPTHTPPPAPVPTNDAGPEPGAPKPPESGD